MLRKRSHYLRGGPIPGGLIAREIRYTLNSCSGKDVYVK